LNERILYEACPLCASSDVTPCAEADCSRHVLYDPRLSPTIRWLGCRACGHIFTEGYFTDEACEILFGKTQAVQQFGAEYEKNRPVAARMIDKVLPFASDGTWLDIGIGNGALLLTAQEYGFHPVGTDLRADNVAVLASLDIEGHAEDIAELSLSSPCSVISMADVLEHMPFPRRGLEAANRLLGGGGVLFVSMPNKDSMLWQALNGAGNNPYWGEIEHYHNFGRRRLYALLEEFGFAPRLYGVSERYRVCMEVVAQKVRDV
jgi:SAM-dependent methyltransferase